MTGTKEKWALILGCTLIFFSILVSLAFAGGGGEHAAAHDSGKRLMDLLYRGINFTLLVIILVVVLKKVGIRDFFEARREQIRTKMDDLKNEKKQAEERIKELERQLRDVESRSGEIIDQFRKDGAAEKERIIAEAKERSKQLLTQADLAIEREIAEAKARLQQEIVNSAAQKAEEIITREIREEDQDVLVDDFIQRVEKLN
jgi:F-type H+-transporting ATPase subunit b